MKKYTIYTEDKNRKDIEAILDMYFDGYTISAAEGTYKGQKEHSLVIDIIYPISTAPFQAAEDIKRLNKQELVKLVVTDIEDIGI